MIFIAFSHRDDYRIIDYSKFKSIRGETRYNKRSSYEAI